MTEFKGTPGPWRYEAYCGSINPIVGIGPRVICSESLVDHDNGKIAMEANARLMAAAPDLLEALINAMPLIEEHSYGHEYNIAAMAIEKALGEWK